MQSWLYGKVIQQLAPEAAALGTSRGYETPSSKTWLRWSVVASDVLGELRPVLVLPQSVLRGSHITLRPHACLVKL